MARLNNPAMRTLFIAFSIAALPAAAQILRGEYPETQRSLEFHLNALANDDMGGRLPGTEQGFRAAKSVSYTHLTLPTICSV